MRSCLSRMFTSDSPETSVNGNVPLGNVHGLENAIAPKYAAWLKMQNGCLVLTSRRF